MTTTTSRRAIDSSAVFDDHNDRYPIEEIVQILDVDADGLLPDVHLLGNDFVTTFYRLMVPYGHSTPVRAPVMRLRRPLVSYRPNQLSKMLNAARAVRYQEFEQLH